MRSPIPRNLFTKEKRLRNQTKKLALLQEKNKTKTTKTSKHIERWVAEMKSLFRFF